MGGRPCRRGVSTSPVTVTPRPSLWGQPLLSPRLKINPVGWNLDFSRAEDTALVGVKDRELPQATSLQASVSLVGTEPADLRVPSGYSQVHTGAQLGVTGLGGSYVSPGFPGPLLTPPLQGQVDRGQASAGRLRPIPGRCWEDPASRAVLTRPCPSISSPRQAPFSRITPRPGLGVLRTGEASSGPALGWGQAHWLHVLSAANLLRFLGAEGPEAP